MIRMHWKPAVAAAMLLGLTGFVLLLTIALLQPPANDLLALATFLLISGGVTIVLLGLASTRLSLYERVNSLRARLVLVSVVTALLALLNVGFTAGLMFLSTHDLALLAGLLVFSTGISVWVAYEVSEPTIRSLNGRLFRGRID